jgi:fatty-acyl-CoA synthase
MEEFDENTAAGMCYTSGTTGDPKGVVVFAPLQRAARLMASLPDSMPSPPAMSVLPVVPLFHANGWGSRSRRRWSAPRWCCRAPKLDGASIYELLNTDKVTFTAAVPTVWLMLLQPNLDRQQI